MSPQLLLEWLPLLPVAAAMLLAVYLPGTVFLIAVRARPTVALAGGPLLTALLLGGGGFLLGSFGISYGWPGFLGLVAALWVLGAVLGWLVRPAGRGQHDLDFSVWVRVLARRESLLVLAAGFLALATLWLPIGLIIDPGIPNPRVDPMYHYNVLNAILETGNVSMNSAVDYNYGLRVGHVMYPTVWHAIAFLGVPLSGIVPAAHALTFLVTPAIFVINAGLLARVVFRRSTIAMVAAVLASGALPAFGTGMLLVRAFWPNALATAMLPGLIVVMIMYLRRLRWRHLRRHPWLMALDTAIVLLAALGLGSAHPSVLFSFVFIVVPLLIASALKAIGVARRALPPLQRNLFVGVLVVLPLIVLVVALIPMRVRSYLLRPAEQNWEGVLLKGVSLLVNWPTDVSKVEGIAVALIYLPLLLGGLFLLARRREHRWIVVSWAVGVGLIVGSYFPVPLFSALSGLWYSDTYRLFAVQATILPLAAAALVRWAIDAVGSAPTGLPLLTVLRRRAREIIAWGLIAGAMLGTTYITASAARHVGATPTDERPVMDDAERMLLERIGGELPEGSVVIGDPASGVAYLPLDSEVESVFTQMNLRDVDVDGIFLAENLHLIHEDPRVCTLLEYYGIGYFYEDAALEYNYSDRAAAVPGFYEVDTSEGFTLLDDAGESKLWRIDACGPITPPDDWWQRDWRREGFVNLLPTEPEDEEPLAEV